MRPDPARRGVRLVLLGMGALGVVALAAALAAVRAPSWWSGSEVVAADAEAVGEALEQGLLEIVTRVSGAGGSPGEQGREWAVRIDEGQLNAWLGGRLPSWLGHVGVDAPPTVRVRLGADRLDVAVRRADGLLVHSLSAILRTEHGELIVAPIGAAVGTLPLPIGAIRAELVAVLADATGDAVVVAEDRWRLRQPDLRDGRHVEFIDVEILPAELRLRGRTATRRR